MPLHLVSPTPATFGRWPVIRLGPEMAVFTSIAMRGAWRMGPFLVARDPRIALRAAMWAAARLLTPQRQTIPAPYAIGLPLTAADHAFVARHAPPGSHAVIADYAFLTPLIASVRAPAAVGVTVMHDLFSARPAQFARVGGCDSTLAIGEVAEMALLGQAGCVIAIQPAEAALVASRLPGVRVLTAPMAVLPVAAAQPGRTGVLFVGGGSAPNVDGIGWFLAEIWPTVRQALPGAELTIIGDAGRAVTPAAGVIVAGRVPSLTQAYAQAAVVISPLRTGSGLKIKLVEALGHGKAIVCTTATVQGVEDLTRGAAIVADEATVFASGVIALLQDPALRARYAEAALRTAHAHFSAAACYGAVLAMLQEGRAS